jgi:hypothetical protein
MYQTPRDVKANQKKEKTVILLIYGLASLIFGSISLIPILLLLIKGFLSEKMYRLSIFSIIGVISGLMGLSSSKKIIPIVGIILSVIGLLIGIILFLIRLGFELEG